MQHSLRKQIGIILQRRPEILLHSMYWQPQSAQCQVCRKCGTVFQKYFQQKAKRVRVKKLRRYDLYAPSKKSAAEKNYTFDQGTKLVLDSLNRFSPKIAEYASRVFNENHIDYSFNTCIPAMNQLMNPRRHLQWLPAQLSWPADE